MILMGIIFIILGNFMTKTRINSTVGVRIGWSMYNDNTWRKSNRFGAYVILASVATLIYAHKVYVQEIESEKGGKIDDRVY